MKTPSPLSFLFRKGKCKSRRGISPVIATTIILAITITLGLALWGFANSGVGTATVKYSEAVDDYGEIVRNHRFVVANMEFDTTVDPDRIYFWIYNSGKIDTTINENTIIVTCKDAGCTSPVRLEGSLTQYDPFTGTTIVGFDLEPKKLGKFSIELNSNIQFGKTYELTITSEQGLSNTYLKKSD